MKVEAGGIVFHRRPPTADRGGPVEKLVSEGGYLVGVSPGVWRRRLA